MSRRLAEHIRTRHDTSNQRAQSFGPVIVVDIGNISRRKDR